MHASVHHALLHRAPEIVYSTQARRVVAGKVVLVTGAGGSIGSEIVRQVRTLDPERVVLLDHDEGALHALQLELDGHGLLDDDTIVLADIRDRLVVHDLMGEHRPDVVFHAAAHKHLPLVERFPAEGIKTNVLGTQNVALAAARAGASRFINISTDKAAAPSCMLGATKRVAERLCASLASERMRVASVRFGNVLGSRGSFLPTLRWQLEHDLPVTITDPDATRYFMSIPEAASLVIEAAVMAANGETFVLDMGEPVRIVDVVTRYADRLGRPDPMLRVTGLRPGEKLHEVLLDGGETRMPTRHGRVSAIVAKLPTDPHLHLAVERLDRAVGVATAAELRDRVAALLPMTGADQHTLNTSARSASTPTSTSNTTVVPAGRVAAGVAA